MQSTLDTETANRTGAIALSYFEIAIIADGQVGARQEETRARRGHANSALEAVPRLSARGLCGRLLLLHEPALPLPALAPWRAGRLQMGILNRGVNQGVNRRVSQ